LKKLNWNAIAMMWCH